MIDTIKLFVSIHDLAVLNEIRRNSIQFKKEDLKTKIVEFAFHTSKVEVGSYNRSINIRIVDNKYTRGLLIELSIPKYAKGNNVEMILPSELPTILEKLCQQVATHLDTTLSHFSTWEIHRLDVCYNWIFSSLEEAKSVMDFLRLIDFPRKKKSIYDTSVMYVGGAYTVKFYLKGPEFRKHDFNDLKKVDYGWAVELQEWADKIVRFEVGFKKDYLENFFSRKKVLVEHITDNEKIIETLSFFLKEKVFHYISTQNTSDAQIREILYSNFSKRRATSLFIFHKEFYKENSIIKNMMLAGGISTTTVWRNETDLKKVGVGFDLPDTLGVSLLERLVIPSESSRFDLVDSPEKRAEGEDNQEVV